MTRRTRSCSITRCAPTATAAARQNPDKYAEVLLSVSQPEERHTADGIKAMYGKGERTIHFKKPIPVYITYQTAFMDDAGQLQARADVYRHDKEITRILQSERRVADVPVPRITATRGVGRSHRIVAPSTLCVQQRPLGLSFRMAPQLARRLPVQRLVAPVGEGLRAKPVREGCDARYRRLARPISALAPIASVNSTISMAYMRGMSNTV